MNGSLLSAAIARVHDFLLVPPTDVERAPATQVETSGDRIEAAVLGLSRGCGASSVAQGLAAGLAATRGNEPQLIATDGAGGRAIAAAPPGGRRWELPPSLDDPAEIAEYGAMAARLAAGGGARTALVWDLGCDGAERAARVMAGSDVVVAVAAADAEPALAGLVCQMLGDRNERVVLVANRVGDPERWSRWADVCLPEARLGALLLARGRRPGGRLWSALERLAETVCRAARQETRSA